VIETVKHAWIAKLLRALETPIPNTPKLLMPVKGPEELAASEASRRQWIRDNVHGGIEKGLKAVKLDKAYQALEPVLGNTSETPDRRATFGARQVHDWAHQPVKNLISAFPTPYGAGVRAYQGVRDFAGSRLGIPKAPSFDELQAARAAGASASPVPRAPTETSAWARAATIPEPQMLRFPRALTKVSTAHAAGRAAALRKFAGALGAEPGVMPKGDEQSHGTDRIQYAQRAPGPSANDEGSTGAANMSDWLWDLFTTYDRTAPGRADGSYGQETIG
jgi:hypothetical protein